MSDQYRIVCAACNLDLNGPSTQTSDDVYSCPSCGTSDTYANVMDEAKAYAAEHAALAIQNTLKQATSGSKFVTYKPGRIPTRTYRFILTPA